MSLVLYHYVHCPFCIRVRMTCSYLKLNYESRVLRYDDEQTPKDLTGKKMLPIMNINGRIMNESLDIMQALDTGHRLMIKDVISSSQFQEFEDLLSRVGEQVHSLAMPYWIYTPEFDNTSRHYFQQKKEIKRGPFKDLVKNSQDFINHLEKILDEVEHNLRPFYKSENFGLFDILLASHLWGLYVVPEFQFRPDLHAYLQRVKDLTGFNYHQDFWS